MYKLLFRHLSVFVTIPAVHSPAFARAMEAGDAAIARQATPGSGEHLHLEGASTRQARRIAAPREDLCLRLRHRPVRDHRHQQACHRRRDGPEGGRSATATALPAKVLAAAAMLDLALLKVDVGHPLPTLKWGRQRCPAGGRPGADHRQSTGHRPVGLRRHRQRAEPRPPGFAIRQLHSDRCDDQSWQLRRPAGQSATARSSASIRHCSNPDENGGFIGVGFAIPSDTAKFVDQLLLDPQPSEARLARRLTLQDMTDELAGALGLPHGHSGAIISAVDASGPASAGIACGQATCWKRSMARTLGDFAGLHAGHRDDQVGKQAHLTVWRDGKEQEITATVARMAELHAERRDVRRKGREAMIASDAGSRRQAGRDHRCRSQEVCSLDPKLTGRSGVQVERDCEASDLGISPATSSPRCRLGPVATPDDVRRAVSTAHKQHRRISRYLFRQRKVHGGFHCPWAALLRRRTTGYKVRAGTPVGGNCQPGRRLSDTRMARTTYRVPRLPL